MTTPVEERSPLRSSWSTTTLEPAHGDIPTDIDAIPEQSFSIFSQTPIRRSFGASSGNRSNEGPEELVIRVADLDKWEGLILEMDGELMTAELTPLNRTGPCLVADFQTGLLGDDARVAEPGDVFYLTVRTVKDGSGYPTRTEQLRLRRLGIWTEEDVSRLRTQAAKRTEQIEDLFG